MFEVDKAKQNDVPMRFWSRLQKGETIMDESDGTCVLSGDLFMGAGNEKGLKADLLQQIPDRRTALSEMPRIRIFLSVKVCMVKKVMSIVRVRI